MPVELHGARIDRIHNNRRRGDPGGLYQGVVQGIHEKKLAGTLPLEAPVNGEAAEQRSRNEGIARESLRHTGRQLTNVDAITRQRVIAKDPSATMLRRQNEWRGTAAPEILSRLFLQVPIERGIATGETGTVLAVLEGFNHPIRWMPRLRHSDASDAPVPPGGLTQPLVRQIRFQKRIHEGLAITTAQCEHLMLPDRASGDFLGTTHDEFGQRAAR